MPRQARPARVRHLRTITRGAETGILTARQAGYLDDGRKIHNGMAHGQTTHMAMAPAMAVPMVTASFTIVSELCAAPAQRSRLDNRRHAIGFPGTSTR